MIVALASSSLLGLLAMSFAISVRYRWAKLFTQDPDILMLTSAALPILGLCELGNCPQTTGCGVLRGSARPTLGANINLGSFYFIGMPVGLLLGFYLDLGFVGFWVGLMAAQASCLVFMLYHLIRTDWNLQAERAIQLTGTKPKADESISLFSNESSDSLMTRALLDILDIENRVGHKSSKETGPLVSQC
jgi:MATE family multidrug resistance protein